MRVTFVLPRSFPYRGGYENSLLALAKYLVSHGHHATIFTTVADDLEAFPKEQITSDGVTIRRFPICYNTLRRRATRVLGLAPYWRWKAQYWRPSFRVPGLEEALQSVDADLIHIGPLPYNGMMYAGLRAGELRNIPVVSTPCTHLGEAANNEVLKHYLQPHQVALLQHCRKVLCMTQTERDRLQTLGVPPDKLAITPFGVDLQSLTGGNPDYLRQRYNVDGPVVLHLGMKAFEKGSETLVEAMKLLWSRGSNAWLVIAGPSLSTFDSFITKTGSPCPKLLNFPPFAEAEKRDLLASGTIVAQPSRVESLGLVLIEAWANRKPVIAADIAVSRELINSSGGGIIAPFGDAEQLAGAIERLLSDPRLREKMGADGYRKAADYDGESRWRRTTEELERLLASRAIT